MMATLTSDRIGQAVEFDRQIEILIRKGYPKAAGIPAEVFLEHVAPLRETVESLPAPDADTVEGCLPFVIVIRSDLVAADKAMSLVEREGQPGVTKMHPRVPGDFKPIDGVSIPASMAYLLVDIDRGNKSINIVPDEALSMIAGQNRSPLTIDEGIAIVTQYPEALVRNHCFSLLASRTGKDRRVPAIWINRDKRPTLGWCWAGNPHTWLGSASCGSRIGA